ncbi:hypothetical protein SAMN05216553_1114 [Lentzea fradiae]|uniref:Uncharacterized protein n=2 Tax=Lentzea fradiae TaxID=200378 RepID=A0A1G7WR64_9PSEU|nr:hypothetical protein SAMN05216553_1114 [Lentzea fradiae]
MGVAVALLVPGRVLGAAEPPRPVAATVVESGTCGRGMDTVEWDAGGGEKKQAKLDGCGHTEGETVEIVITGTDMVSSAASVPAGPPVSNRVTALLLCLAALAGGFYAFLFRYAPLRAPAVLPGSPAPVRAKVSAGAVPPGPASPGPAADPFPSGPHPSGPHPSGPLPVVPPPSSGPDQVSQVPTPPPGSPS